ncbi:PTPRZ-like protein [Mya arenaria]|uniref:protein-tyrosine-phosphatase n=1 Tax=Mya arenaria TaxID=6604 RepID=A0ABY7DKZ5_MYAAR|nr:PTPRZ-like protein [Mya arenaria]
MGKMLMRGEFLVLLSLMMYIDCSDDVALGVKSRHLDNQPDYHYSIEANDGFYDKFKLYVENYPSNRMLNTPDDRNYIPPDADRKLCYQHDGLDTPSDKMAVNCGRSLSGNSARIEMRDKSTQLVLCNIKINIGRNVALKKTASYSEENQQTSDPGAAVDGYLSGYAVETAQVPGECDDGQFGKGCSGICGHCLDGLPCNKRTGYCDQGCTPGWTAEPTCIQECDNGTYGVGCMRNCSNCFNGEPCEKSTECEDGTFGRECQEMCLNCFENDTCNKSTGKCPRGCQPGWQGYTCDQECADGSYGLACNQTCSKTCNGTCEKKLGICPDCIPGVGGDFCDEECLPGMYGARCKHKCGACGNRTTCHTASGICATDVCEPGYKITDKCHEVCDNGHFGHNCSHKCGNCEGVCNKANGHCEHGCIDGFEGEACVTQAQASGPGLVAAVGGSVGVVVVMAVLLGHPDSTTDVTQFHYTAWPDKDVPNSPASLIHFWRRVRAHDEDKILPWLVHCSAGVGRTGTFIAMDVLYEAGKALGTANIFECVKNLRDQRVNMVQTAGQYRYIHTLVKEMLVLANEPVSTENFAETYTIQGEVDVMKLQALYEDYINDKRFVISQTPLKTTVIDYLRLIHEHNIRLVIAFDDHGDEKSSNFDHITFTKWTPKESVPANVDHMITLLSNVERALPTLGDTPILVQCLHSLCSAKKALSVT